MRRLLLIHIELKTSNSLDLVVEVEFKNIILIQIPVQVTVVEMVKTFLVVNSYWISIHQFQVKYYIDSYPHKQKFQQQH